MIMSLGILEMLRDNNVAPFAGTSSRLFCLAARPNEMGVGTSGDRHLAGDRPLADAADAIADSFDSVFDDDGKVRLRSLCQSMQ